MLEEVEAIKMQVEINFLLRDILFRRKIDTTRLVKLLNAAVDKARRRGRNKFAEQRAKHLAESLQGGAGMAHKMANSDNLLPPRRLVIKSEDE